MKDIVSTNWDWESQNPVLERVCNFNFRFILHAKKTAFIVEHDFIMATYMADRVVVFEGQPSVDTRCNE